MRKHPRLAKMAIALVAGGWMFQLACARQFQNEIEVLLAPEANGLAFPTSILYNWFGPGIIKVFNK